ncbi:MAG: leucine-rich repeat domain-containing protein [Ruminococcus sp.]|nr:leucine-rich repeat domain-containing protein [Ruminococcus sp.]
MPEHTIAENLTRLQNATTAIGNAITAKGGTVGVNDGLEDFASDIATIPSGGEYNAKFVNTPTNFVVQSNLKSVNIPNGVTSIGDTAFSNCTNLNNIEIPNSVTSIGVSAFNNCTNLNNIEIPNSVTSIGDSAFYNCSSLNNVNISNSVTSIGTYAFYGTNSLRNINIYQETDAISGAPWGANNAQINWLRRNRYSFEKNEASSGTTLTTSVSCAVGDLIVATFETFGGEYNLPSGWTLLGDSGSVVISSWTQRTGMAYKIAESTTESFTLTQASSGRMFTNLIAITGASIGTFSGFIKNETNNTITATKPQGLTIWAVSTMWWGSKWDVSPMDNKTKISYLRCENFLDQSDDTTVTFTTDTTQPAGGLACASLTITGIDNFWYYDEPQT